MNKNDKLKCGVVCFNSAKIQKLQKRLPDLEELGYEADFYKAMGHPVRLAILSVVEMEECCVCDLANILVQPVSTISQHLRTLKIAGILKSRKEGKLIFYSLKEPKIISSRNNLKLTTVGI